MRKLVCSVLLICFGLSTANAQLECLINPRKCVKEEVDEQNKILTRLWWKQQLIRYNTQVQTEKSTMSKLSEVFHHWQQLRDFYKTDASLLSKFSAVFIDEYQETIDLMQEINSLLNQNYFEPLEKQRYLNATSNMAISLIRANDKVLQAGKDNEHSGTFWSFISLFERTDELNPDSQLFDGAKILQRENTAFKDFVSTVISVLSVGYFEKTANVINTADRVEMLEDAEDLRSRVKRDLHRLLQELHSIITIKKRNASLNPSNELLVPN